MSLLVLASMLAYIIVVDLGLSAGKIHPGVTVRRIEIGGLTETEAAALLFERGQDLFGTPVTFTTENLNLSFSPVDVGWTPRAFETVEAAMRIGRTDAPFGAAADRVRAWFGGIDIEWAGKTRAPLVTELIDEWERQATALGLTVCRGKLRYRIRRSVETWPRRIFHIPPDSDDCQGVGEGS